MLLKILVIDDDVFFRELVKDLLQDYPVAIYMAANGYEGMNILKQEPIRIVITDIIMPDKEGFECIVDIKKNYPEVKIIAVSGGDSSGSDFYLKKAMSLGADASLVKPFQREELLNILIQYAGDIFEKL